MIGAGEDSPAAGGLDHVDDPLVISRHDDLIELSRPAGLLQNMDDKRFAGLCRQDFLWKSRRSEAGWDDADSPETTQAAVSLRIASISLRLARISR
jgi:hypothetical protein